MIKAILFVTCDQTIVLMLKNQQKSSIFLRENYGKFFKQKQQFMVQKEFDKNTCDLHQT